MLVLDGNGKEITHSQLYVSLEGIAWPPSGEEVWLAGTTDAGWADAIYALRMNGQERIVLRLPGMLRLHDISRDGATLLSKDLWRSDLMFRGGNEKSERNLSWLDYAQLRDITDDGKMVSIADWGQAAGTSALAFVRKTDGSPAVKLGAWDEPVLSPDGTKGFGCGRRHSWNGEAVGGADRCRRNSEIRRGRNTERTVNGMDAGRKEFLLWSG